jgi:hypothetical protein
VVDVEREAAGRDVEGLPPVGFEKGGPASASTRASMNKLDAAHFDRFSEVRRSSFGAVRRSY